MYFACPNCVESDIAKESGFHQVTGLSVGTNNQILFRVPRSCGHIIEVTARVSWTKLAALLVERVHDLGEVFDCLIARQLPFAEEIFHAKAQCSDLRTLKM